MTALRSLILVTLVAALVSACGVRGPLEPPPGAEDEPKDPPFILDPLVE
ncbi:MAG TPA: lipoprotein [Aestuariivirgaceae bacterium]|jgi:predicted small lipoprotein YifL|nr:lipoprotein [Aestuariivirgaceae bacterium]